MKNVRLLAVLGCALFTFTNAHAADSQGYVGINAGLAVPASLTGYKAGFAAGFDAGYFFMPELSGDFNFEFNSLGGDAALGATSSGTSLFFTVGGTYHILSVDGLYVGAQLGLSSFSTGLAGYSSTTDFAIGANAGYDYKISSNLTLGLAAKWNMILATSTAHVFDFVVPFKYWF